MGIRLFSTCSLENDNPYGGGLFSGKYSHVAPFSSPRDPNPDPHNFKLQKIERVGRFVIALVEYPDCTTFEGRKILVFENVSTSKLKNAKVIDPHFCDSKKHISPVARFKPTNRGWEMACEFADMMSMRAG